MTHFESKTIQLKISLGDEQTKREYEIYVAFTVSIAKDNTTLEVT
jgi:hypothetical protein